MARLFDQTLTQVDELTKTLDSAYGTRAIPPFFTTLLQTKLELLWWCEPDLVDDVDTQIKRLHQFVEIRVRLEGKDFPKSTWSMIDCNLNDQLERVLSLFSQDRDWSVQVLDILTRTRHRLMSTAIDIDWAPVGGLLPEAYPPPFREDCWPSCVAGLSHTKKFDRLGSRNSWFK